MRFGLHRFSGLDRFYYTIRNRQINNSRIKEPQQKQQLLELFIILSAIKENFIRIFR